jgi:integrase
VEFGLYKFCTTEDFRIGTASLKQEQSEMLSVYTRHSQTCEHREDINWRRCRCPKWIQGVSADGRGPIRETAKTRSWEQAEAKVRRMEQAADHGTAKRCHPHMFRDTFAVELLLSGVPIDQVSLLLGHSSVKITEKHYAPFVKARQEQLEGSVKLSWQVQAKWMETEKLGVVMRM